MTDGKSQKNKRAFVLLPPECQAAIELLLELREEVGICDGNEYIFARPNSLTSLTG